MLRRLLIFIVAVLILLTILVWSGFMQSPLGTSAPQAVSNKFAFQLGRNAFGDRVLLTANAHISFIPQSDMPDRIVVTEREGPYPGDVAWTVMTTPRGEGRLIGEVRTGGRSYRVCEYLARSGTNEGVGSAERIFPVNNVGTRFRNPEPMDPALLAQLLSAIGAEQAALSKEAGMAGSKLSVSGTLSSIATQATALCLNQGPQSVH